MMEISEVNHVIHNTNSTIKLLNNGVFYVCYKENVLIEITDFEETRCVYESFSKGEKLKFLVEFPEYVSATAEARKFAEDYQVDALAEAIVFTSLAQRILIRFYISFRKQKHPVKIFTTKEKALNWLNNFPSN